MTVDIIGTRLGFIDLCAENVVAYRDGSPEMDAYVTHSTAFTSLLHVDDFIVRGTMHAHRYYEYEASNSLTEDDSFFLRCLREVC